MKKPVLLGVFLSSLFLSMAIAGPGDTLWTRTYGGSESDKGYSVQQTTDGGYVFTGTTQSFGAEGNDVYLIKTDANGDTVWTRAYGGINSDDGRSVQQTTDGGYIIAGYTNTFGAGNYDVYLIKTDAGGDTLWTGTFGYGDEISDQGQSVQQTFDGGYIVVGHTGREGNNDVYLVKTDAAGDSLWTRAYGGSESDKGLSVQQTADSGYIVAGYAQSFGAGGSDIYLLKTDASGDTLWTRTYGGSEDDEAYSVQQAIDGGYILAGFTMEEDDENLYLVKTDANGDIVWTRTYGGSSTDWGYSVQQITDGGYVIAGYTRSFGAGSYDVYLLKTDSNGDTLWTRTYGGTDTDRGYFVQQTTDGGYIVAGQTRSFGAGNYDFYLLKIAGELPETSIEIIPDDPPVTVPQGGRFGFTGSLTNNTEDPQVVDAWVMASGPAKEIYGPFKEFYDVPLAPSQSRSRHFSQRVPNLAPLGFYDYIAYCGDYPSTVIDSSFFQIEVIAGEASGSNGWILTGSFLEGDLADLPSDFVLIRNYPNPFNASTVISYELPTSSLVKLEVYNISGQKVATLVDSQQEAGYRSARWDASEVSSGLYFYKLTAGDFNEIKRMILVR